MHGCLGQTCLFYTGCVRKVDPARSLCVHLASRIKMIIYSPHHQPHAHSLIKKCVEKTAELSTV